MTIGLEFLNAFADVLRRVEEFPESGAEIAAEIRRVPLRRFPYCLFYSVDARGPVVLGCLHAHRDPEVWQRRKRR